MPLTLTFTEGALPEGAEKQIVAKLTDSMLKWHGLVDNTVMTPTITAQVHVIPKGRTFTGGQELSGAWVEWKAPSFAFSTREIQIGHIEEATNIVHEASGGNLPKNQIWVNVVHAVDGAWGIGGLAMTNAELGEAISKG
ncbi:MAG: 4-oxalocrotonate tautomerase [Methylovulum miyakonense]|uniref:4-oxalocrotonate tautomerase n=1 Tax=Methylovulum miyakonense TaxID=645578 RepID=UPI003BB6E098